MTFHRLSMAFYCVSLPFLDLISSHQIRMASPVKERCSHDALHRGAAPLPAAFRRGPTAFPNSFAFCLCKTLRSLQTMTASPCCSAALSQPLPDQRDEM